jgi:hypothetical protein
VREGSPLDYLSRPKITKVSGNNNDNGSGNLSGGGSTPGVAWGHLDGAMRRCLFGEGAIGVVMPCKRPAKGKKLQLAGGLVGACFESAELIFEDLPVQVRLKQYLDGPCRGPNFLLSQGCCDLASSTAIQKPKSPGPTA